MAPIKKTLMPTAGSAHCVTLQNKVLFEKFYDAPPTQFRLF
jgi:hypothetical protein